MFVSLRRYTIRAGSIDALARRLEDEFVPAISQEAGFLGFLAVATGEASLETISVFANESSAHRSDALAAEYVAEHLGEFEPTRTGITGGDVIASRVTPAMLDAAHRWSAYRLRARRPARPAPVLVIGATGRTGRQIVARLIERRIPVHALVRDIGRGRDALHPNARLFVGDVRQQETLAAPMRGVSAIIIASSGGAKQDNSSVIVDYFGTENVMKEAAAADVRLAIYISSIHATRPDYYQDVEPTSLGWKARAEELVRASGVPYCVVRAGWLTDGPGGEPLVLSQGDIAEGRLSRSDLADVCAQLLFLEDARGKTFEVVAARAGEHRPLAAALAELTPDRPPAVAEQISA